MLDRQRRNLVRRAVSVRSRKITDRGFQALDRTDVVVHSSTTTLGDADCNLDVSFTFPRLL
jgi:hypothetical protein